MRALGLVVCGLLLAACTSRVGPPPEQPSTTPSSTPPPEPLTAAAAFGDLRTIDYCSLLDVAGEYRVSSFQSCRTEVDFEELTVGPLSSGADPRGEPYGYAGDLPPGVRLHGYSPAESTGCLLWLGFADDVWLSVTVADVGEPPWDPVRAYCATARHMLAGVLDAIDDARVGHVVYGPDSFGSIDPCPLITGSEFAAVGGGSGPPVGGPSGHVCVNGRVQLSFRVDWRTIDTPATVGGREATVAEDLDDCSVLFQRPLPGEPRFWEKAIVSVTDDETCVLARGAAELVAPKLPR